MGVSEEVWLVIASVAKGFMALVRIGGVVVLAAGVAKASAKGGAESSAKGF